MGRHFAEIAFTPTVQEEQTRIGSRPFYAAVATGGEEDDRLGPAEAAFLATRESFYLGTVNADGWPYIQHRGGPKGFVHVLDPTTFGWADFRGNRQHISVGNLTDDGRVALFFMDYAHARRLKVFGHARVVRREDDPDLVRSLHVPGYRAVAERAMLVTVAGYDWNCPQHIPRLVSAS